MSKKKPTKKKEKPMAKATPRTMKTAPMTMDATLALPELKGGTYKLSPFWTGFINIMDRLYPGVGWFLEQAAEYVPFALLLKIGIEARKDFLEGKDIITIFTEMLEDNGWSVSEPDADGVIRFSQK